MILRSSSEEFRAGFMGWSGLVWSGQNDSTIIHCYQDSFHGFVAEIITPPQKLTGAFIIS